MFVVGFRVSSQMEERNSMYLVFVGISDCPLLYLGLRYL